MPLTETKITETEIANYAHCQHFDIATYLHTWCSAVDTRSTHGIVACCVTIGGLIVMHVCGKQFVL